PAKAVFTPMARQPTNTTQAAAPVGRRPGAVRWSCSAGLAVQRVPTVPRAVLHHLEPVGVVPPVLLGDVVALLALRARQGDLGADVGALRSHGATCSRYGRTVGAGGRGPTVVRDSDTRGYAIVGVWAESRL